MYLVESAKPIGFIQHLEKWGSRVLSKEKDDRFNSLDEEPLACIKEPSLREMEDKHKIWGYMYEPIHYTVQYMKME